MARILAETCTTDLMEIIMNPDLMTREELVDKLKEKVKKIDDLNDAMKGMQKRIDELNAGGDTEAEMYAKEADKQRREMKEQLSKEKLVLENKVKILEESNKQLVKELRVATNSFIKLKNGSMTLDDIKIEQPNNQKAKSPKKKATKKQSTKKKRPSSKKSKVTIKKTTRKKKNG